MQSLVTKRLYVLKYKVKIEPHYPRIEILRQTQSMCIRTSLQVIFSSIGKKLPKRDMTRQGPLCFLDYVLK